MLRFLHRFAPLIITLVILGFATTVLVAWALAAWLPHRNLARRMNLISQPSAPVSGSRPGLNYISVFQYSRPGMVRLSWRPGFGGGGAVELETDLREHSTIALGLPTTRQPRTWGRLPTVLDGDFATAGAGGEDARGWPLLALWCQLNPASPSGVDVRGGITLSSASAGAARVLPWFPIWRGIAADSGFYAISWGVGLFLFVRARAAVRRRRGLCPRCGYDLRAGHDSACAECGWKS